MKAVLAVVAVLYWLGCGSEEGHKGSEAAPAAVSVVRIQRTEVPEAVEVVATAEPYARAELATRLMGRVVRVAAEEGDRVHRGQVLVQLEVEAVKARVNQAESGLAEVRAVLAEAESHLRRQRNLMASEATTGQRLEAAQTAYERAAAGVEAAEQALAAARADLEYGVLRAPMDGIVVGKFVQTGDLAAPGMPLLALERQDSLKVMAVLAERDLDRLRPGDPVEVFFEGEGTPRSARVEAVVPAADARTRTVRMRAVMENAGGRLVSGMFARVRFGQERRPAVVLPAAALVRRGQLEGVFVVEEGRAWLRWVRLGDAAAGGREVLSGIEEGQRVVVGPPAGLRDGQRVEVDGDA